MKESQLTISGFSVNIEDDFFPYYSDYKKLSEYIQSLPSGTHTFPFQFMCGFNGLEKRVFQITVKKP
jgi:hypothetical protein